jgi:hypothetical protein
MSATIAFNAACSASLAGELDSAFELLTRAHELGFKDIALDADPDLERVRADPRWPRLRSGW